MNWLFVLGGGSISEEAEMLIYRGLATLFCYSNNVRGNRAVRNGDFFFTLNYYLIRVPLVKQVSSRKGKDLSGVMLLFFIYRASRFFHSRRSYLIEKNMS